MNEHTHHWSEGTPFTMPILAANGVHIDQAQVDRLSTSFLGRYWHAVNEALEGKQTLDCYRFAYVRTTDGMSYRLMTDIDAIRQFFLDMTPPESGAYLWLDPGYGER